jgi:hypothetical protein
MKKTLTFTGDIYQQADEFKALENAMGMSAVAFEIRHNFYRSHIKNSDESPDFIYGMEFMLEKVLELINEELNDN